MRSMTGFGRAEITRGGYRALAEVRALNQRFFELKLNLPRGWGESEAEMRKIIQGVVERGRVEAFIRCVAVKPPSPRLHVNDELAASYVAELRRLGKTLRSRRQARSGGDSAAARDLPGGRGGSRYACRRRGRDRSDETCVTRRSTRNERARAGRSSAISSCGSNESATVFRGSTSSPKESRATIRASFESRVRELLAELPVNEKRLYEEASNAAQHGDITEEMTRLRVHLQALRAVTGRSGPMGKSIEFLLQEINREVNTMGAKSQNAALSQITIEMKGEVEKMREQVQNVE